jgi:hypothetical protein
MALGAELKNRRFSWLFSLPFSCRWPGGVNALSVDGDTKAGAVDAVSFIRDLRQASDLAAPWAHVVVIGGGMTAVDGSAVKTPRCAAGDDCLSAGPWMGCRPADMNKDGRLGEFDVQCAAHIHGNDLCRLNWSIPALRTATTGTGVNPHSPSCFAPLARH